MSVAPRSSGLSILIFRSSRPGLNIAGSIKSCLLVAPIMMTFFTSSTPSSIVQNIVTAVFSTSLEIPEPLIGKIASISSKNMTTGQFSFAFSLALAKASRIFRSVSPTHLVKSSGPLTFKKYPLRSFWPVFSLTFWARPLAIALAIIVLPQPGGP